MDDSPTSLTPVLVDYLLGKGIETVFFCIGSRLQDNPNEADRIVQAGFLLGNHSFSHRAFSTLSLQECREEIQRTGAEIEKVYQRNSAKRSQKLFRFPYGDKGGTLHAEIQSELFQQGFEALENSPPADRDTFWTFDTLDYKLSDEHSPFHREDVLRHLDELASRSSDEIVLMHDNPTTNALFPNYYRELIERIEAKGVVFVRRPSES